MIMKTRSPENDPEVFVIIVNGRAGGGFAGAVNRGELAISSHSRSRNYTLIKS